MMNNHTQGPWVATAQASANFYTILTGNKWLASVQFNGELMEAKQEANARLIAAAPELLEACKKAEEWLEDWASAEPYMSVIRAAIAKAGGAA
jgi:hypothetical protein